MHLEIYALNLLVMCMPNARLKVGWDTGSSSVGLLSMTCHVWKKHGYASGKFATLTSEHSCAVALFFN